jgi:hypothetical protein
LAEQPQKGAQRRRRPDVGEQPWHAAVAQQVQIVDRVRSADHARDDGGGLRGGVDATLRRDLHMLAQQSGQPAPAGQRHDRDQPGARHEIRIVERCGDRAVGVG